MIGRDYILEELKNISRNLKTSMVSYCKGRLDKLIGAIESGNYPSQPTQPQRKADAKGHEQGVESKPAAPPQVSSTPPVDPFSDWED